MDAISTCLSGCIPCKTHAGRTSVTHRVYANVESWRTPEVQKSNEPCF